VEFESIALLLPEGLHDFISTHGKGVDVILDMVGDDYIERNLKVVALDGRIVHIAFLKGSRVNVDMMPVLFKRLTLTGSALRPRSAEEKAAMAKALHNHIWPLIARGDIKPVIAARYALQDAAKAHQLMESSAHIGKILLLAE
jgi:NADPH:quinone reductase